MCPSTEEDFLRLGIPHTGFTEDVLLYVSLDTFKYLPENLSFCPLLFSILWCLFPRLWMFLAALSKL